MNLVAKTKEIRIRKTPRVIFFSTLINLKNNNKRNKILLISLILILNLIHKKEHKIKGQTK